MGRLLRALTGGFDDGRFQPVSPVLPPDGWISMDGLFRFGFPWPWEPADDSGDVVDATGGTADVEIICSLTAPRSNGSTRFLLWRSPGSFRATLPTIEAGIRSLYGAPPTRIRWIQLAGVEAAVIEVPYRGEHIMRLIAHNPHGNSIHGELTSPTSAAAGYRTHLDTMLGTWGWS